MKRKKKFVRMITHSHRQHTQYGIYSILLLLFSVDSFGMQTEFCKQLNSPEMAKSDGFFLFSCGFGLIWLCMVMNIKME